MTRFRTALGLTCVLALGHCMSTGCSERSAPPGARRSPPSPPDTLLERLAPRLGSWTALWRHADREFEPARLRRTSQGPFTLRDIRPYDLRERGEARRRRLFAVFAPDSERFVDPDRGLDFDAASDNPGFTHGPDSTGALVDLRTRSIATLEPNGPSCRPEGAFWLDPERFALTGSVGTDDSTGLRCGFVLAYDLHAGVVTEYRTPAVDSTLFRRFVAARESAWLERLRRGGY